MASPFAIFRKNQKAMYALLAIMCMVGFSIGGFLSDPDRMRGDQDPVVATAYGKSIRAREVQQLLRRRRLTIGFLAECKAAEFNLPSAAQYFAPQYEMTLGPATEEAVVETWLLDERARQMGMVVSDGAINSFLKELTNDKVKAGVFIDIAKRLEIGQQQLFDALRAELMALRLREMALGRLQTTPAQRWDYYRRQKQLATVEVGVLPVEDFIGEVPDANDEELHAFFEEHKEREPDPQSPTPGFKVPKKADFQVVVARFADYYDEKAVTEAEIKKRYDDFKDTRYLWERYDFDEEPAPSGEAEKPAAKDDKPAEEKPGDKPADDSEEKPAHEKPADENLSDKADAGKSEKKNDTKPADEKGKKPQSKPDEKSQSSVFSHDALVNVLARPSALVMGLLADDESSDREPTADSKPADDDKKASAKPVKKEGDEAGEKDAAASTEEENGGEKSPPAKVPAKKAKASKGPKIPPQIGDDLVLPRDIRQGPHPKHAPLWRVEEVIRKEVAREKANERMETALSVVRDKMRKYARRLAGEETEEKMPDLDKIAKAQGLTSIETGMLTARELAQKYSDLAQATGEQGGSSFVQFAYTTMAKFQSTTVQDIEANRYLVWKVEEKDAFVPDFAEVRSTVLRVWKLVKARDLAMNKAKEMATEANKAGKPLKELFADRKGLTIKQPPAFSWLTRGSANVDNRSPLRTSEVEGVDSAGPEFMRETFSLSVGACGEVLNQPKTVAYVVRLVDLNPASDRLRNSFVADPFQLYNEVAREDMMDVQRTWMKGIEEEAKLTWKEKPSRELE